jgi:hypothetical protein
MADVSKIEGPSGPPESSGKKDKSAVDADKFKQEMRRRVTEVSQVDPDEQKKRKRREEAEEEEEPVGETATPPSQVTPFSLEQAPKKASPMAMEGPGISPTESAQKTSMPAPPPKTFQTSSSDEMADDSGMLEEEAFTEAVPTPPPAEKAPVPQEPPRVPAQTPTQETPQPQVRAPAEAGWQETGQQPQPQKKKPAEPVVGPPVTGVRKQQPPKAGAPPPPHEKKGTTAADLEQEQPAKRAETARFFEEMGKEGGEREGKKPAKTPEELAQEAALQGAATPAPAAPFAPSLEEKKEKKVEGKEIPGEETGGAPLPLPGELPGLAGPPPTPEALPSYANIHPQVMELFDRMVGVMTVMSMSGITETVITLNTPQFASSVFFGSQIIIQEYSTAPQAYNIQLNGSAQAVALFQGNADDLMAAFQAGNYNFRVNRLETGHLTERPLFKRKEKAGGEKEAGEGQK